MAGSFWTLFDFDRDGTTDAGEKAAGTAVLCSVMDESTEVAEEEDSDELYAAGIDPEALGFMGLAERRGILTRAGLDPDDYDF